MVCGVKGMAGVIAVAALAVAAVWAGAASSAPQTTPSANALAKKVKRLERRVNALALAQTRDQPQLTTRVSTSPMLSLGGGQYYGTAYCGGDRPVGGGVQLAKGGYASDHIFNSYPVSAGWYGAALSSGGTPTVYAVCAQIR